MCEIHAKFVLCFQLMTLVNFGIEMIKYPKYERPSCMGEWRTFFDVSWELRVLWGVLFAKQDCCIPEFSVW